jgi:hypothetical protein
VADNRGMLHNWRVRVLAVAVLAATITPSTAFAEGHLLLPTLFASGAATADWATTYHALKFYRVQEENPFLKPLQATPGRMISVGALMDVGGVTAWNAMMGPKHQRLAAAGLWTMTAFRVYLAVHNHMNEHRAQPK